MTHDAVMKFIVNAMAACLWVVGVCSTIIVVGFGSAYYIESQVPAKCINSACETKCKGAFKRHEGCIK